jgi:3-hydroxyisobutyrate dehydrogenase-like beta-hydroxyacid dehydrogenase
MPATARSVGWLGTGRMGAAMAARLIDAGHPVTVWNRTRSKTEQLAGRGALVADRIADLAACPVVFVTVTGPADLEQVVSGPDGLLSADRRPEVVVDCSTVSPEASAHVRTAAEAAGVEFLAAPVSGNPHVVADGGANLVVSGRQETFERVRPYLEQLASTAVYVGDGEQSRLVKLCTNLYLGMMVQALVEVTSLAEKGGTDRAAFLAFFNSTGLGSAWTRRRAGDLIDRDWTPTFTTELLRKDFDLGIGAARELEVPMPVASAVYQLIQAAVNNGLRDADFLALYDQQARTAGLG